MELAIYLAAVIPSLAIAIVLVLDLFPYYKRSRQMYAFSVFPNDLAGFVGHEIAFDYNPLHASTGGNVAVDRYSGTIEAVKEAANNDIVTVRMADNRGYRSFVINRMSRVAIVE